jgi:hypothetical protein
MKKKIEKNIKKNCYERLELKKIIDLFYDFEEDILNQSVKVFWKNMKCFIPIEIKNIDGIKSYKIKVIIIIFYHYHDFNSFSFKNYTMQMKHYKCMIKKVTVKKIFGLFLLLEKLDFFIVLL